MGDFNSWDYQNPEDPFAPYEQLKAEVMRGNDFRVKPPRRRRRGGCRLRFFFLLVSFAIAALVLSAYVILRNFFK